MTMTPEQLTDLKARVTEAVRARGGVRRRSGWWTFPCPNGTAHEHGDRTPSGGWDEERGIWKCLGCGRRGGAVNLAQLLNVPLPERHAQQTMIFPICDRPGAVVAEHHRLDFPPDRWCATHKKHCTKHLWWRLPNATRNGLGGRTADTLPLYGVHELPPTAGATVVVVEGEKARDALAARDIVAVGTVTGAATIPSDDVLRVLVGADVVCWPDADAPGRDSHMRPLAARLRALGASVRWFDPWPDATDGRDAADFRGNTGNLRLLIGVATSLDGGAPDESAALTSPGPEPWSRAVTAATFVAELEADLDWLEPRLLAPGSITEWFSPRGLGKTQVALALAVKLAGAGHRVLLLDRDNSRREVRRRLRAWGAANLTTLHVMTRDDVPPLTDRAAWKTFPFGNYELVIIDSLDASTEGVGEKDSAKPSQAVAPLLDIAHRADGPAILILGNTIKSGTHGRSCGVTEDRADIVYEVRDATDFHPTGTKPWWTELPAAGREAWADWATRRHRRTIYRLAFVASKFRVGEEPDPFGLEIDLRGEPWQLRDSTEEIEAAGEDARTATAAQKAGREHAAVGRLAAEIDRRAATTGQPLMYTEAVAVLEGSGDQKIPRKAARTLLERHTGSRWRVVSDDSRRGHPKFVVGMNQEWRRQETPPAENPVNGEFFEGSSFAVPDGQARQETDPTQTPEPQGFPDRPSLAADPPDSPLLVRCAECGGDRWEPDPSGMRERCAACGTWSPCSVVVPEAP
jgi:hypothetical protein